MLPTLLTGSPTNTRNRSQITGKSQLFYTSQRLGKYSHIIFLEKEKTECKQYVITRDMFYTLYYVQYSNEFS